jgi:hypothetical protein
MRRRHFLSALLLLGAVTSASATITEIPLPELVGQYPAGFSGRTANFHLPGRPAVIRSVSLHARGTAEVGLLLCDLYKPTSFPWYTRVAGWMEAAPGFGWSVEYPNSPGAPPMSGAFEWTVAFIPRAYSGPDTTSWYFLQDGEGSLTFNGDAEGYVLLCHEASPPPTVQIDEISLIIDADYPVPAVSNTWGQVKAIYRR